LKFIDALRLKSKLFILFILITLGLFIIGVLGTLNLISMKKKIDALYFGSFITVVNLDEILNAYDVDIQRNLTLAKENLLSTQEAIDALDNALTNIDKHWSDYHNHYKTSKERPFVTYATKEIIDTKLFLGQFNQACQNGCNMGNLSIETLNSHIDHIHTIIAELRSYEIQRAQYQREELIDSYHATQIKLGIILILISGGVLLILYIVFKSIQKDQSDLESVSKKLQIANKKLENASYTDSLTNLYNRRYFNIVLDREIKRAKRATSEITFMMLDVDFFKQYNDTYGHIEGDKALIYVAKNLRSVLQRPGDFVFRLGGEEFGVFLTDTGAQDAQALAGKICHSLEELKIPHAGNKASAYLTISIGAVSCVADETLDGEEIIKQADKKLYEAKENGRNRVEFSYGVLG
jgi:diguanylate cyclase (GGDEF)-like protein